MSTNIPHIEHGTKLSDRYTVIRALGAGPNTMVYLGRDELHEGREVALKIFFNDLYSAPDLIHELTKWVRVFLELKHPDLLELHAIARFNSLDFYSVEYMDDGDLSSRLGRTSISDVITVLAKIASALDFLHQRSIIYRNVKPTNVLFSSNGHVKLSESIIARDARSSESPSSGKVTASLEYVAPEYLQSRELTASADIYALGSLGYELVTGKQPFVGRTVIETMRARLASEPIPPHRVRPDCPDVLSRIILKAMSADPGKRFYTSAEMHEQLLAC